jgi:hypothetical protein
MLNKSIYDLIGAFGVGGGKHLVTIGTVEKQHINHCALSIFSSSQANS